MSADYFNILQKISAEPEQAFFVTMSGNRVNTLGFNVGLSDVVVLAAAAVYRAYVELPEEVKEGIPPQQVMQNLGIQFDALIKNLGTTTDEVNRHNASLPQTGQSRHHNPEAQDIIDVPPEAYATTGDNSR